MQMVRTTVYLEASLVKQAKIAAASRGSSLTKLVESGLKKELTEKKPIRKRFRLKSYDMGGCVFKRKDAYE